MKFSNAELKGWISHPVTQDRIAALNVSRETLVKKLINEEDITLEKVHIYRAEIKAIDQFIDRVIRSVETKNLNSEGNDIR